MLIYQGKIDFNFKIMQKLSISYENYIKPKRRENIIFIKFDIAISSVKSFANNYNNNVGGMIYVQFNDNRKKSERIR